MAQSRKERQRLKRKKKQQSLRKQRNTSQYALAARGEVVECWINSDWAERGQAVPFIVRRMSGGRLAMATFMVDLWCAGLKDAWGRLDIAREEFQEIIDGQNRMLDGTVTRTTLETVAAVVAGAVRFAVQNGFRLPDKYERWVAFCGANLDWRSADLSKFGVDDGKGGRKLRWVAPMFDLRRRLVGMSVEEFMQRPDVEVIAEPDYELGDYEEDEEYDEEDDFEEEDEAEDEEDGASAFREGMEALADIENTMRTLTSSAIVTLVRDWCIQNAIVPEDKLAEAVDEMISRTDAVGALPRLEPPTAGRGEEARKLAAAMDQVDRFVKSFPSHKAMEEAIGRTIPKMDQDEVEGGSDEE